MPGISAPFPCPPLKPSFAICRHPGSPVLFDFGVEGMGPASARAGGTPGPVLECGAWHCAAGRKARRRKRQRASEEGGMSFGDILVAKGLVSAEDIAKALEHQKAHGGRIGDSL